MKNVNFCICLIINIFHYHDFRCDYKSASCFVPPSLHSVPCLSQTPIKINGSPYVVVVVIAIMIIIIIINTHTTYRIL